MSPKPSFVLVLVRAGEVELGTRALAMRTEGGEKSMLYTSELEKYRMMMHLPEEVALLLTRVELRLFQQVAPANYLRHVTCDLSARAKLASGSGQLLPQLGLVEGTPVALV